MYKFYSLSNPDEIENLIGKKSSIRFSSAYLLNDPFELKFNLEIDISNDQQRKDYFENLPNSTEKDYTYWCSEISTNSHRIWYIEQEQRNTLLQNLTLCSFTLNNTNNLMWSHYASQHKGICIKYSRKLLDFIKKNDKYINAAEVKYSNIPPIVQNTEKISEKSLKLIFNKQSEWSYEEEFRIALFSKNETDTILIENNLIDEIYIGSRASQETITKIIELTKNSDIQIYFGITLGKTYDVTFERYKKGTIFTRSFW